MTIRPVINTISHVNVVIFPAAASVGIVSQFHDAVSFPADNEVVTLLLLLNVVQISLDLFILVGLYKGFRSWFLPEDGSKVS